MTSELLSHSVCPTTWTDREAGHLRAQDREACSQPCHPVVSDLARGFQPCVGPCPLPFTWSCLFVHLSTKYKERDGHL